MVDWWSFGILIYELLYGTTPFRGARRDATFENVLKKPLVFPDTPAVSAECKDLIAQLLHKEPAKRLGARAGADEIKRQPWFSGVHWALVRNQKPPFVVPRRASQQGGETPASPMSDSASFRAVSADVAPAVAPKVAAPSPAVLEQKAKSEGAVAAAAGGGPGHIDGF
jgi:serine/threonine protein kinase